MNLNINGIDVEVARAEICLRSDSPEILCEQLDKLREALYAVDGEFDWTTSIEKADGMYTRVVAFSNRKTKS